MESSASIKDFQEHPDIADEEPFADPTDPLSSSAAAEKAREKAKAEKPKPWYKEYVDLSDSVLVPGNRRILRIQDSHYGQDTVC